VTLIRIWVCLQDGLTALALAAKRGHADVMRKLLAAAAEVDIENKVRKSISSLMRRIRHKLLACAAFAH
jgi:ankyrin repeat protein